jgi:hypothetical protein
MEEIQSEHAVATEFCNVASCNHCPLPQLQLQLRSSADFLFMYAHMHVCVYVCVCCLITCIRRRRVAAPRVLLQSIKCLLSTVYASRGRGQRTRPRHTWMSTT